MAVKSETTENENNKMGTIHFKEDIVSQAIAVGNAPILLAEQMELKLKELLEKKFLYQNVKVREEDCRQKIAHILKADYAKEEYGKRVDEFLHQDADFGIKIERRAGGVFQHRVGVPATVNTRCECCKEITPHNPIQVFNQDGYETDSGYDQTFVVEMQCQKCKQGCLSCMVRRSGWNLQLVGRNQIDVYRFPYKLDYLGSTGEQVVRIFAEAMMAERTGSWLSAVCLLRVALEQFMRAVMPKSFERLTGEEIYEEYEKHLASDFPKNRVVSFRSVYGRLSEILHNPSCYVEGEFPKHYDNVLKNLQFIEMVPLINVGENVKSASEE